MHSYLHQPWLFIIVSFKGAKDRAAKNITYDCKDKDVENPSADFYLMKGIAYVFLNLIHHNLTSILNRWQDSIPA